MKNFFCLIILLFAVFPLFGFSNVDYGAEICKNGNVSEFISIKLNNAADELGESQLNAFLNEEIKGISEDSESLENLIASHFVNKINNDEELDLEKKNKYIRNIFVSLRIVQEIIVVEIKFETAEMWKYFCESETEQEYKHSFLTYDAINTLKPRISSFQFNNNETTTPEFIFNYITEALQNKFGEQAMNILNNPEFSYSYITSKRRVHSDADEQFFYNGYWHHKWSVEDLDNMYIKLYTTHANSVVWYLLSLGFTGVFMTVVWIFSRNKKTKILNSETSV